MPICHSQGTASIGRYLLLTCLLACFPTVSTAQQPRDPNAVPANAVPANAQPRYWTTNWSFEDINVGKLADRLDAIDIDIGVNLRGKVSVQFEVGIPVTSLGDAAAYRFDGTLTSPSLVVDGVLLKDLSTSVSYRDGMVTLENLSSLVIDQDESTKSPGYIKGRATAELVPREDVTAEIAINNLAVAPLADLLAKYLGQPQDTLPGEGTLSGNVKFRVPLNTAGDIATYQLDGNLSGRGLRVASLPAADFDFRRVRIQDETLLVDDFSLTAIANDRSGQSIRLLGNASFPLSSQGEFTVELFGDDIPVGTVAEWFVPRSDANAIPLVRGKVDFQITGNGKLAETIERSQWNIRGAIASPQLHVAGVDLGTIEHHVELTASEFNISPIRDLTNLPKSVRIGELKSRYSLSDEALTIEQVDATLFSGSLSGSANIPFSQSGIARANLSITAIKPRLQTFVAGRRLNVSATLDGDVDWQVPLAAVDQPSEHSGQAKLALSDVTIGEANIGSMRASASADTGDISFTANGRLFDGKITVATTAKMFADDRWSDLPLRLAATVFKFDDVSLDRLYEIATGTRLDLTGSASGEVNIVDWNPIGGKNATLPSADIRLALSRVSYRSRLLSRSMRLNSRLRNNALQIISLTGDYADGSARINGRVYLFDEHTTLRPRADLHISASRINLQHGLWFLGDAAGDFQGRASIAATVAGYQDSIRVRGNADGRDLVIYGMQLGNAHSGLTAEANVLRQSWKVRFASVRSSQGGGEVEGELSLASTRRGSGGVDLESRWHTRRVDFVRLTQQLGRSTSVARGEITGDLTLNGKSIQSVDDLNGRFRFALGQTRGSAIPGMVGVSRFLGPVSLVNQRFDVGEAKGFIGRGAITFDEFWVGSDSALVQADGKVFIRSGRMDLNALIATGDYRDIAANFAQLAQQYALRSLLPASAILDISELLRDRTLVVHVIGTVQDPVVRVQSVQTFREEAARFLLREGQRLILTGITAGAVDGLD
ncbi:AsmA-like C-terminal region-containing protein [Aporhodopirellula aestuarii]|uniref:AsmA-like C-terminal region-containing protein n=1 Tax=Aporhodopirellula aestuarii TaxID=2950107 RepID=A0ABT0U2J3_9BACT|nr:AsmA-like C-terminal region-containing protein [Aporhodopirellula aestuarii]MCM2371113.1 AsmA-like C-terminal region-containing protein [Aporhodopirellula aestuarii]